ncbi:MAG: alanine racemase [Pseudomonadota bacterium]
MVPSPNRVFIDLSAVAHNLNQVKKLISPATKIMGIVKSDAYGHGHLQVSRVLENEGIFCLGVAHVHEALELRQNGIKIPIVILCGIRTREEAGKAVDYHLTPVLFDLESAKILNEESIRNGMITNVQLKVDTGMGRLGICMEDVVFFFRENLHIQGPDSGGLDLPSLFGR